ncbi:ubiquinol-cytochrome C chaperone family protein [Ahrensia sp. R2A130]|uniref:ubiquinol-cytochrome C chaperone family protein n=1 Tax=Ahrensia sp. R2A130 TaxID=744979 RepID=UPI0001E083B5|nr:ubiquinol-cytochrome C chaperone family protein [Ahrensia sp. R2A130]EFL90521.1 ubiquinol-cytochrome C chaperone [Ahrensia sp. R2A130]
MFKALMGLASRHKAPPRHADRLYGAVVARARDPLFFARYDVPDTFDGRFESLVLHLFLLHHRLKDGSDKVRSVSQGVFDAFIDDIDASLREAGVGDQTVPKRINKMTRVFYGRTGAIEEAIAADDPLQEMAAMVARNVRPDEDVISEADRALAAYLLAGVEKLAAMNEDDILGSSDPWPPIQQERAA